MTFTNYITCGSSGADISEPERITADWREHIVTGVATSLAVLMVATIAVLMGMA